MFELKTTNYTEPISLKNLPTLRQAFVVASLIIIVSYVLAALVHPNFIFLPLLVAGGLMLAGLSGFCPMVALLQRLPGNKQ